MYKEVLMRKGYIIFALVFATQAAITGCSNQQQKNATQYTTQAESQTVSQAKVEGYEDDLKIIKQVYGDDYPRSYSMSKIGGTIKQNEFICDFSVELTVDTNYVIMNQYHGDSTDRTIEYDISSSGECKFTYDSDNGESVVIWSGEGSAKGTSTITLSKGANCLNIHAAEPGTSIKLKLKCIK